MRPKVLAKRALLIVGSLGFVFFVAFFFNFILKNSIRDSLLLVTENVDVRSSQEEESDEPSVRLRIPAIGVDSVVISVGLTSDGAMDVPKGPDEVAWFNLGPRPGEQGSAVVAGHYDWKDDKPAVFDNLHKLSIGDRIIVEDEEGLFTTFVVRKTRIYGKDEAAPEVFGSSDGKSHLNLITCTGIWNVGENTFSERLVVFTDKVL